MSRRSLTKYPDVTRVEVIDSTGRAYSEYAAEEVAIAVQDDGKTLKVFLSNPTGAVHE